MKKTLAAAVFLAVCVSPAFADQDLSEAVAADYDASLAGLFVWFHSHPELSFRETETAARLADELRAGARAINQAVNKYLWDGQWFGRGITDDGVVFGVRSDPEGRIFLNPQSWSILSGAAGPEQRTLLIQSVAEHLETIPERTAVLLLVAAVTAQVV